MEMRATDVLHNLKDYDMWDFQKYRLNKEEADQCIKALEEYVEVHKADMMEEENEES